VKLHAYGTPAHATTTVLGRISTSPVTASERPDTILVGSLLGPQTLQGYAGALTTQILDRVAASTLPCPVIFAIPSLDHLADGDVVAITPQGYVRTLYRRQSPHNTLFATDRCNSYCLMCSQPPKNIDDAGRIAEHLRLIDLIHQDTTELGITGGEPTLLKDDLLRIIAHAKDRLPRTSLHLLSNGRLFYYARFAQRLSAIQHHNLMIGIPLYSDLDTVHDYVVQAKGSYEETIVGLHNLARYDVPVELRVVLHQLTVPRLAKIAEFIYRNLPFARHVALMGLEMTGFTLPNKELLWADPWDYQTALEEATTYLIERGMHVSIYNHQLCTIPRSMWPYARKSISDWKNEYLPVCSTCTVRDACGGFFTSGITRRYSKHINSITADQFATPTDAKGLAAT